MKKNQLKIGIVLSYISIGVNMIIQLVYTPVMLRLLGQSEYGLYQLVNSTVSYLSLLSLGFGSSYIRFFYRYRAQDDQNSISKLNGLFIIVFLCISFITIIAGLFLVKNTNYIFGKSLSINELTTAKILMIIMIFNIALTFPASVFESYVTAHEQFFFQRVISLLRSVLNPFLTLPLLLLGYKSVSLVVITSILTIFSFLINVWYCLTKLGMKFYFKAIDYHLLLEIAGFSFFIFINQIIDQINWNVDKFILGIYSGTAGVALYSLGSTINTVYLNFSTSISNVFVPKINKMILGNKNMNDVDNIFIKVGRIQFYILLLILTGFIFIGIPFMSIWGGQEYVDSYYVTLLLIIPVTIPLIQNLGIEIQRAMNKHKFRSIVYLFIAILNILISIPLCKLYGAIGSALGTCLSLLLGNGLIINWYYHTKMKMNMLKFWKEILSIIPSLILPILFGIFIVSFFEITTIYSVCLFAIIYSIIYFICVYNFAFNNFEKDLLHSIIHRFYKKEVT